MDKIRVVDRLGPPECVVVGVDLAKPGDDRTVVRRFDPTQPHVSLAPGAPLAVVRLKQGRLVPMAPPRRRKSQKATQRRLRFEANREKRRAAARLKRLAPLVKSKDVLAMVRRYFRPTKFDLEAIPVVMNPRQLDELRALGWEPKNRPTSSVSSPAFVASSRIPTA